MMEDLKISELRKKNLKIGIRLSEDERKALDEYCQNERISITSFFRLAIRELINNKHTK